MVESYGTCLWDRFQSYLIADASKLLFFRSDDGGNIGGCFKPWRECDRTALLRLSSDTSIRQLWWGEEYRVIQSSYSSPLWRSRWIRRPSSTFSVDGFRIRVVGHSFLQGVVLALLPLIILVSVNAYSVRDSDDRAFFVPYLVLNKLEQYMSITFLCVQSFWLSCPFW